MSNARYLEKFKELVEIVQHFGLTLALPTTLVNTVQETANDPLNPTEEELQEAKDTASERFYAIMFLCHADRKRYGNLVADLENAHTRGNDEYPKTLTSAFDYLINYKAHRLSSGDSNTEGMSFYTNENDDDKEAKTGSPAPKPKHFRGKNQKRSKGQSKMPRQSTKHQAALVEEGNAPDSEEEPPPHLYDRDSDNVDDDNLNKKSNLYIYDYSNAVTFYQETTLTPTSLIMDSASSVNIITNKEMLTNITRLPQSQWIPILTVGKETVHLKHKGNFGKYPEPVWFYPHGQVNIISLHNVQQYFQVTMNTDDDNAFHLHVDGRIIRFGAAMKGIYALDNSMDESADAIWDSKDKGDEYHVLYGTVNEIKEQYTKQGYKQAVEARKLQNIIMRPSTKDMNDVVLRHFRDCPVTRRDIEAAEHIFGPNLGSLKGKTTRQTPSHVPDYIDPVPQDILIAHRTITICVDIMFVNQIPFLITISRNIKFITVEALSNRRSTTLSKALSSVVNLYCH